jgi:hypothetical protein
MLKKFTSDLYWIQPCGMGFIPFFLKRDALRQTKGVEQKLAA